MTDKAKEEEALRAFVLLLQYPQLREHVGTLHYDPALEAIKTLRTALEQQPVDVEGLEKKLLAELLDVNWAEYGLGPAGVVAWVLDHLQAQGFIGGVPEGYVMVPIEPTEEMEKAGQAEMGTAGTYGFVPLYKAMIQAATPPAVGGWQDISTAPRFEEILTWDGKYVRCAYHAYDDVWMQGGDVGHEPTHWKPLPTPPTEERENNGNS